MYTVTIGQKAYSSWSLRGWLPLAAFGLPFREELVRMYTPDFAAMRAARAPARSVPQLSWEEAGRSIRIWDSAAIAETLAERHPDAGLWPEDAGLRRVARVLSAQMHSGFGALRSACPMNIHRSPAPLSAPPEGQAADLDRLAELWTWALAEGGGPFLAGPAFSLADVAFAPVTLRLEEYALETPETAAPAAAIRAHPAMQRWIAEAKAEPDRLALYDRA